MPETARTWAVRAPENWTLVIVTKREDLDGQIYLNFANTEAVLEAEEQVQAKCLQP